MTQRRGEGGETVSLGYAGPGQRRTPEWEQQVLPQHADRSYSCIQVSWTGLIADTDAFAHKMIGQVGAQMRELFSPIFIGKEQAHLFRTSIIIDYKAVGS